MDLEKQIDWQTVLAQPRYAGGHEEVMRNIFGKNAEVIAWWSDNDYQGTIAIAYEFPTGEVAIMTDYYGSCSACDWWEDSGEQDARNMIVGLCGSARQFQNRAAAKEWCANINRDEKPWEYPWDSARNLNWANGRDEGRAGNA